MQRGFYQDCAAVAEERVFFAELRAVLLPLRGAVMPNVTYCGLHYAWRFCSYFYVLWHRCRLLRKTACDIGCDAGGTGGIGTRRGYWVPGLIRRKVKLFSPLVHFLLRDCSFTVGPGKGVEVWWLYLRATSY